MTAGHTVQAGGAADPARDGYVDAAGEWAAGPMLAYQPLAHHLVARCPLPLHGALVLDAGAGTGAATTALLGRGAMVVAADLQRDMLARLSADDAVRAVADVAALPIRSCALDAAVAAFVLNHLARPWTALAELRRVVRPGGAVLASCFSLRRATAKNTVDEIAAVFGWVAPPWYAELQARAAAIGTVARLSAAASRAGLVTVTVSETEVDLGLEDPDLVARYRLGMPQLAPFVRDISPQRRRALVSAVTEALVDAGDRLRPAVLELVARVSEDEQPRKREVSPRGPRHAESSGSLIRVR